MSDNQLAPEAEKYHRDMARYRDPKPSSAGPGTQNQEARGSLAAAHGSRLFRSAGSGLWYANPKAAGSIDAVEMYGERIYRTECETTMEWIDRVADWAEKLHSANGRDQGRP